MSKIPENAVELKAKPDELSKIKAGYARQIQAQEMRKQISLAVSELIFEAVGVEGEFREAQQGTQTILGKIGKKYLRHPEDRLFYDAETEKLMVSYHSPSSQTENKNSGDEDRSNSSELENSNNGDTNTMSEQNKVANDADVERDPAVTDPTLPPSVGQGEDQTAEDSGGTAETSTTEESTEESISEDEANA